METRGLLHITMEGRATYNNVVLVVFRKYSYPLYKKSLLFLIIKVHESVLFLAAESSRPLTTILPISISLDTGSATK